MDGWWAFVLPVEAEPREGHSGVAFLPRACVSVHHRQAFPKIVDSREAAAVEDERCCCLGGSLWGLARTTTALARGGRRRCCFQTRRAGGEPRVDLRVLVPRPRIRPGQLAGRKSEVFNPIAEGGTVVDDAARLQVAEPKTFTHVGLPV